MPAKSASLILNGSSRASAVGVFRESRVLGGVLGGSGFAPVGLCWML
ncbi:MAG: hypothetical protein QXR24_05705 [Thermosphaera sp.]